jgi:Tfp pilus assembly PilM family ATPase
MKLFYLGSLQKKPIKLPFSFSPNMIQFSMIILNSVLSWFIKKEVLFLELGNCSVKATIFRTGRNSASILQERSFKIEQYYNGRIRNRSNFIKEIQSGFHELTLPEDILIGIDSSHLNYKCFQFEKSHQKDEITSKIESEQNRKIIYSGFHKNKVAVLLINKPILEDLESALKEAGINACRFVASRAFTEGSGLRTVVDIGYRSTNISVFQDDFPLSYKTVEIGMERILMSIAEKFAISLEDAKVALQEAELSQKEKTRWLSPRESYMNKCHISTFSRLYLEAFLQKVLNGNNFGLENIQLTGWANKISGISNILENTSCLPPIKKSKLIYRMI